MMVNIKSMQARMLNIAKEKNIDFQLLLNRLAAEQFLCRLSQSPHVEKFIFKGGFLLHYLIDSDRKTKDLDFSMKQIRNQVDDVVKIIRSVLDISIDDGIEWKDIDGELLIHPEMDYPGVRLACHFLFGKMKGLVRMDMAIGDAVDAVMISLQCMQYKGQPFFGESFSLLVYPPETIFAEKLHIALKKRDQNTRMKDYYDLFKLIDHDLDQERIKKCIQATFANRKVVPETQIQFEEEALNRLQVYWGHFLKREKMSDAPAHIGEIISKVNIYLQKIYGK
ncbi:MAG: nucleotidyl transferase AbiEii/AbiGii toxin family protein [Deltaproteobacteria bacterium]|nr:nucleotidyl transferase AbiEii/AbiGii toxin family protein [Deltaproteobacteria bacterium]